jgi:Protein of unknown function (DUF2924)
MAKGKSAHKVKPTSAGKGPRKAADYHPPVQPEPRTTSKQAEVIGLLRRPQGSTIPRHHEGHRLATAFRPRVLRGSRAQKARPHVAVREAKWRRPRLSDRRGQVGQTEAQGRQPRPSGGLIVARRSVDPATPPSRSTPQLAQAGASLDELRREWRRLYHNDPPRISRDLLILGIGYRFQELEHGGLGKATRRKLQTLAKTLRATGRVGPTPSLSLKPGARLVREWHGRTHTVTVSEDGFEYSGTSYPSLTKIAKKITGAHWSGPRFFGLPAASKKDPSGERND